MLNKSISLSRQVSKLTLKEKLFFTWAIPHLDDYGCIENDPFVLKATVCPMVDEIKIKDIQAFIRHSAAIGLAKEFEDCLVFLGFENHQSLSPEKRTKPKFEQIPKNPQENSGENKNPQNSPVQEKRREEKVGEGKGREIVASAPTPKETASKFFNIVSEKSSEFDGLVSSIAASSRASPDAISRELTKFASYWTEPNATGKKLRWEKEPTFEVKRRLTTWFGNVKQFSGSKESISKYLPAIV